MTGGTKWGVCATIKAPPDEVLRFAAHHLEAGAHRVWIYLDAPNDAALKALTAHPKCRAIVCNDAYWQRAFGRRPDKHQVRQSWNATRAYERAGDVIWLLHADADEFLVSERPVVDVLEALPTEALTARVRPMEALATQSPHIAATAFKTFIPPGPERQEIVRLLYPQFGSHLKGGFLSHVAGKLFVRTGLKNLTLRIHNAFQGDQMNPASVEVDGMQIAHLHAPDWPKWRAHLDYRLHKGAYRAELLPASSQKPDGESLHDLLAHLHTARDEDGLRDFFEEVAMDSESLRARLRDHGVFQLQNLDLEAKKDRHFPAYRD